MNKRRLISALLAASLVLGVAGCGGSKDAGTTTTAANDNTGGDPAVTTTTGEKASNKEFEEAEAVAIDPNAPTGTIKWLVYEDLLSNNEEMVSLFKERYNAEIEQEITTSGAAYFDRLGVLLSSDLSPDIVRYEWMSFPHGISKNMYTPLDSYIDLDSDLWSEMKDVAEQFAYNGKHYYVPNELVDNFSLNYNRLVLEEYGLDDPMELYHSGEWTWSAFEDLIEEWCNADENHIGYTGVEAMAFVATTGTTIIDVHDGLIENNLKSQNVQRAMDWLESLARQGYFGEGYKSPEEAFLDGNLLFLGMQASWAYGASWKNLDKKNIDCEMAFVPFPRDEKADAYYQAMGTAGYMIPSGAKNIKGALDWIVLNRTEKTDPENVAEAREKATDSSPKYAAVCAECKHRFTEEENETLTTCPDCSAARKEKFNPYYTDEQYDVLLDMTDASRGVFSFVFDDYYGFSDDMKLLLAGQGDKSMLDGPLFSGASFTQLRDEYYNSIEGYLDPYREKMAQDATAAE